MDPRQQQGRRRIIISKSTHIKKSPACLEREREREIKGERGGERDRVRSEKIKTERVRPLANGIGVSLPVQFQKERRTIIPLS
jgi:hypothetical protein